MAERIRHGRFCQLVFGKLHDSNFGRRIRDGSRGAVLELGNIGPWLIKFDSAGNQQWNHPYFSQIKGSDFSTLLSGEPNSLVQTPVGGYALAGGFNNGVCIIKTDAQGFIEWNQSYLGVGSAQALIVTSDGGFALVGSSGNQTWLGKTDADGKLQWSQTFGNGNSSYGISLVQTSDGGYALLATANYFSADTQAQLIKTDSSGKVSWMQTFDWPFGLFEPKSFIQTSDGGYIIAARLNQTLSVIKTDPAGNVVWNQTYSQFVAGSLIYSVIQIADGGFAFGGGFPNPMVPGILVKVDSSGVLQWNLTVNGFVSSIVQTSDGQFTFSVSSDEQELVSTDTASSASITSTPMQTTSPTPTFSPIPSPTFIAKPSLTPSWTPMTPTFGPSATSPLTVAQTKAPSESLTHQPTLEPSPTQTGAMDNSTSLLLIMVGIAVVTAAVAGALFYFRKKKDGYN